MTHSIWFRHDCRLAQEKTRTFKSRLGFLASGLMAAGCIWSASPNLLASDAIVTGSVRVQLLSSSLIRLELKGAEGFEDRNTFHVVNRDWPGTSYSTNLAVGEVVITTPNYVVHVPAGATSLTGVYITTPDGQTVFQSGGSLNNSVWLPGPSEKPVVWSFADTPRLVPPPGGIIPQPPGGNFASTSGWDTNNDAPDVYVFVPDGSYKQLRSDFLKLTGHTGMIPLWALGCWDSRWYDYSESTALDQVAAYRSRHIPLDALVCDTGWRVNASTGYQPNANLFPDLPQFFSAAHAANVHVMFNDHPEPVASNALDPAEITYRYTNLAQLLGQGLDVWWYDRNWGVSLVSPSPNLRHEVWGMRVYHDATDATNASLRPMIMANVDGIDNGIRNRPMNVAAHNYPIQWTGDIGPSTTYLQYAVQNAVHSGVQSLFPYESDDLGGHTSDPSPEGYIRWIEYGVLSPIYRPHCTYNLTRMPWTFGPEAEWIARRLINLRYRLLPVFYAAARENYDTGEPLLRRLDLDYPQYPEATRENQYLIGHSILVAPVIDDGSTTVFSSWLTTTNGQPGLNAAYFSNTNLTGSPTLTRVDSSIDFNWNSGSPGGSIPSQNFTVRWTGNIAIPSGAGDVTLAALSDDGVRVWVNNQLCIDNWNPNDSVTTGSTLVLTAGQTYSLRVEYLQLGGKDVVALKYRGVAGAQQSVWIPPGSWINAWDGAIVKGPATVQIAASLGQIPIFVRSGTILALAPQMQYTGQLPWSPVTLDCYPSTTETDSTTLYEDDTLTTAYQQGQFRTTSIKTWADDANKTVSVSIAPAAGSYANALTDRSWVVRLRRPAGWPADLAPVSVTLNGGPIGPVLRRVKNTSAMPLGADNGAPDADVFEITVPATSVLTSNVLVASFVTTTNSWNCADIGAVGANGNAVEGASTFSNSVCIVRGAGAGIGGTNDGFHFLYQPCVGNTQMTIQLSGQQSANALAKSGIMISESLDPAARNAVIALSPGAGTLFQCRLTNGLAAQTTAAAALPTPCWLRLVRSGNTFSGYASANNVTWNLIGSTTISGFSSQAYLGLVATATITNTSETSVDETNNNTAVFGNLTLANPVFISTLPDQITAQSTPTPAVPFTVGTGGGNGLALFASSSNTNLLTLQNIVFSGAGSSRSVTLTPNTGITGTSTVTVTASNNLGTASTQFMLTVYPFIALGSPGSLLINDNFSDYQPGNLPGQSYLGTGFNNGVWLGVNSGFNASVADAGVVSYPGLTSPTGSVVGGKVTVKGDGSNVEGFPDLSSGGPFAAAGLRDATSGTVGGGNVSGTLYLSFLFRAVSGNRDGEYGGLHLSRGTDATGVLIGNTWTAHAFSILYAPTDTAFDLKNYNGTGSYLIMDNNVHLLVAKIIYVPGADDTLTAWLDPVLTGDENSQNFSSTYIGTLSGNLSFDRILLRGGNSNQFEYGALRFGTSWSSVLPAPAVVQPTAPEFGQAPFIFGNMLGFSFFGDAGQPYSVLCSTNLSLPNWQVVTAGTFGFDPVQFQASITDSQRFFRISIP